MFKKKRNFKRIACNVRVGFQKQLSDRDTENYFQGIAKDCGLNGFFLETQHLMPKGSVVSLNFQYTEENGEKVDIQARAVVRWTRRYRNPKGMGLELFEFNGFGDRGFKQCFERLFQEKNTPPLY